MLLAVPASAQRSVRLDLKRVVQIATDSTISAERYQSVYQQAHFDYKAFLAGQRPQIYLSTSPIVYDHYFVQRYLSDIDRDVYRSQRRLYSEASLAFTQPVTLLGGILYGSTGLAFLKSFGQYNQSQFTTVPILVGYQQELMGFNSVKWERRIQPLKMERARKKLTYQKECDAANAAEKFFNLMIAQTQHRMAIDNLNRCDSLCSIGERKFHIASISKGELLTLEIDRQNARNSLASNQLQLTQAMNALALALDMESGTHIELIAPSIRRNLTINLDEALRRAHENNPEFAQHQQAIAEAERDADKAHIERRWNINLNLRLGLNQVDQNLWYSYTHPQLQDYASLTVKVPIKDWGLGKSKILSAAAKLDQAHQEADIASRKLDRDVETAVATFNAQQQIVAGTEQTQTMAEEAYRNTFLRFAGGKATVNDILLAQSRWQTAQQNYVNALKNYWMSYFEIRKLTLHQFF